MRIALVFPPFFLQSLYNLPPLGLINLATVLNQAGHEVAVIDLVLAVRLKTLPLDSSIYGNSASMILREEPDLVAFSVQCATFPAVIRIAEILRKRKPGIRIVAGGHDVSFADRRTLERFPWFDAVVRGEGEVTIRELANDYAAGGDGDGIDGVTRRRGAEVVRNPDRELIADLDRLPLPDYSLVPGLDVYRDACGIPRAVAILEAGRGCPHSCVYCSESAMWRRRSRTFPVPRIVREMRRLRDKFGAECFLLAYDQFTADRGFAGEFCRTVIEQGLNTTPWYCISRLDSMDLPLLRLMREAGCESMCYGVDSGSARTLAFIGKRIDHGILYQRVRETTDEGMVPTLSFVIGFPEEEREDIDQTLFLALRAGIQGNSNPLIQLPTVLPGTELHRRYHDRLVRGSDTYFSLGLEFDKGRRLEADTRLIESDPFIFSAFHNLPCAGLSLDELERIASWFPFMVNLYPKSFLLLALAIGKSPSELFAAFVAHASTVGKKTAPALTPVDCREHLPGFVERVLDRERVVSWGHLPEVVLYESLAIDAGECTPGSSAPTADLCMLEEWFPVTSRSAMIREFRYNLPAIIADMKDGVFREQYPEESTILVFLPRRNGLEVTEINGFGRDLLQLCDGSVSMAEITAELYRRYGTEMDPAVFSDECREAVASLMDMELLQWADNAPIQRKEVISC
jgi:radical SAM superfamily enzyme YgiQ (UPF0313 family)